MDPNTATTTVTETVSMFSTLYTIGFSVILPGIIAIIVSYVFDLSKNKANLRFEKLIEIKLLKYNDLILFMQLIVDPLAINHKTISNIQKRTSEETDHDFFMREVKLIRDYIQLISSTDVLNNIDDFLLHPTKENFDSSLSAMRKDVWGRKK